MQHNVLNLAEMMAQVTPFGSKKIVATTQKGNAMEFSPIRATETSGFTLNLPELVFTSGEWAIRYVMKRNEVLKRDKIVNYKISDFEKIELV